MYSKKAQLEINETILVLIIFSILAIAGIVVFHRYNTASIQSSILESNRLAFYDLLNQLPNSPELKCSSQNIQEDCIDLFKSFSFAKLEQQYIGQLGYKTIRLKIVYPRLEEKECSESLFQSSDFPNCNTILLYEHKLTNAEAVEKLSTPVAVYNPLNDEYMLGLLEVEWQY